MLQGSQPPSAIRGLAPWSTTSAQLRERGGDGERRRQVLREQQQVVGQAGVGDGPQPAAHVLALEPARIGLVVDVVADTGEPGAARRLAQRRDPLGGVRRGQVDPADDGGDEAVRELGGAQQLQRLLLGGGGLHHDGRGDARRLDLGAQLLEAVGRSSGAKSPVIHG